MCRWYNTHDTSDFVSSVPCSTEIHDTLAAGQKFCPKRIIPPPNEGFDAKFYKGTLL